MQRPGSARVGAHEEAATAGAEDSPAEAGRPEQEAQLAVCVVEDRAVADHLVAQLANRALHPAPAREARHDAARADLSHAPHVPVGVLLVVEVPKGEDDVEAPLDGCGEEVALDELDPLAEAAEALFGEVEHL